MPWSWLDPGSDASFTLTLQDLVLSVGSWVQQHRHALKLVRNAESTELESAF